MQMWQILNHIQLRLFSSTTTPKSSSRPLCHHKEILNQIAIKKTIWLGFFSMQWHSTFFYKHPFVIFLLPLLLHSWQYTDPSQQSRILLFLMIQSNVHGGDLQSRLYFPPYLWWMSEISLPLNDFNISSPSLFPFLDLVITLPRQGFDFSSEEMSENNHFHRQLTLLAPFPFRIGCVLTPYWSCLLPTSKRLVPTSSSISRSTII